MTVAVIAIASLSGCSGSSDGTDAYAQATVQKDISALTDAVGSKDFGVLDVIFNEYGVQAQVRDPKQPDHVDEYIYANGDMQDPQPVDVSGSDDGAVDLATFKLSDIDPAVVAKVSAAAAKDGKVDDAKAPKQVHVTKGIVLSDDSTPQIIVDVQGPRGDATVTYDLSGALVKVD